MFAEGPAVKPGREETCGGKEAGAAEANRAPTACRRTRLVKTVKPAVHRRSLPKLRAEAVIEEPPRCQ